MSTSGSATQQRLNASIQCSPIPPGYAQNTGEYEKPAVADVIAKAKHLMNQKREVLEYLEAQVRMGPFKDPIGRAVFEEAMINAAFGVQKT